MARFSGPAKDVTKVSPCDVARFSGPAKYVTKVSSCLKGGAGARRLESPVTH